jgi:hypothetical protein
VQVNRGGRDRVEIKRLFCIYMMDFSWQRYWWRKRKEEGKRTYLS